MKSVQTVDEYISLAPEKVQQKLRTLRATILSVAPDAEEKISYGMPYYGYKGRLAYFSHAKKHIGLYVMPPTVSDHKKELQGYETSVSTVRFPLDAPLPIPLIKKLVLAGVRRNEKVHR